MWLSGFYRFYVSVLAGVGVYYFLLRNLFFAVCTIVACRIVWFLIERLAYTIAVDRDFKRHIREFKQQNGPYGIRIANKAERDRRIKQSLADVFTSNRGRLKKTVEQLEVLDTIFNAGMRPEGDEYLLHDLKLKYGRSRLDTKKHGDR